MNDTTKWIISTAIAVVIGCAGGAFAYLQYSSQQSREMGRIEAENSYLKDQIVQLKQDNEKSLVDLRAWELAYRNKDAELTTARSSLASVQHDECKTIWLEVLSLENTLSWASTRNYDPERRDELRSQIAEHKKTHQICLTSRK
ncbi:hypothetical protein HX794_23690 [Pseudomonas costantinii]|uniref:hypothetical protein n=1 Tax=Pseudomonas costantinii TaxID=168469 RepID=UPI0015A3406C|nr:hypothetical protein [Pseudomonas costantinii]NVZ22652.1 hypothetical protein [Pseudomonas costantinii]